MDVQKYGIEAIAINEDGSEMTIEQRLRAKSEFLFVDS